jgi:hypothetical protein
MLSYYRPKNSLKNYEYILDRSHDKESFTRNRTLFKSMLEAYGPGKWSEELNTAFDFSSENLAGNPADVESFNRILRNSGTPGSAVEGFKLIQEPVKNESYDLREKALCRLVSCKADIRETYELVKNNYLPGETLDDTAILYSEILKRFCDSGAWGLDQSGEILKTALRNKGKLNSSEILNLMDPFRPNESKDYLRALNAIKSSYNGETFKEREKEFLSLCRGNDGSYSREKSLKAIELFEDRTTAAASLAPGESFQSGIEKSMLDFMERHAISPREEALDIFTQLGKAIQKGVFGTMKTDQIMTEFYSILTIRGKGTDSLDHLIHKQKTSEKSKIVSDNDEVNIGGVRLRKRK